MQPTHKFMMELTKDMPCKQINIEKAINVPGDDQEHEFTHKAYLQRHYAGSYSKTHDLLFHRIIIPDSERHVHSHPFEFRSEILVGSYREELLMPDGTKKFVWRYPSGLTQNEVSEYSFCAENNRQQYMRTPGRSVDLYDWHRIVEAEPNTWTMLIVDKRRLKTWHFLDDEGNIETRKSAPQDWFKHYKKRGENPGDFNE